MMITELHYFALSIATLSSITLVGARQICPMPGRRQAIASAARKQASLTGGESGERFA
jgi:hypothetical protein